MATTHQYDMFDDSLFVLPESYRHQQLTVLNPQAWAETVARKRLQDAADRAAAAGIPTLEMI